MAKILALTQGDPAGVGPEIVLKAVSGWRPGTTWRPLVVAERSALETLRTSVVAVPWERLVYVEAEEAQRLSRSGFVEVEDAIVVIDPVRGDREVRPGEPNAADARGAVAAIDLALELTREGIADAIVTAPVSKETIARHLLPDFRGHTDYLAGRFGELHYGRDYLMTFVARDLRVALLSVHLPLREALDRVSTESVVEALLCLERHRRRLPYDDGPIALAGLNPHAGEGGLLGREDEEILVPAVARARAEGAEVFGPESPDTIFHRARRGEAAWVLALYHDQGLIAVKTAAFAGSTNLTLGLPVLRTSVDHGTAYSIAGRGIADAAALERVIETTVTLLAGARAAAVHRRE